MAEIATLARPYAKAVFDVAREEQRFDDWSALLEGIASAVRDPVVARTIGHPAIRRGQLADALIAALGDRATAEGRNLLRILAEHDRLTLAPAISEQFEALRAEAENRVDVEVVTAAPVDAGLRKTLVAAIKKRLERDVRVEWKTDPDLIAGARIRAGDLVIDGSAAGELDRLRNVLTA